MGFAYSGGASQAAQSIPKETPPFSMVIEGPSAISSGSELRLRVSVTNETDHSLLMGRDFLPDIDIRDSEGKQLPRREEPKVSPRSPADIEISGGSSLFGVDPGRTHQEEVIVSISKGYDLSRPGKYTIQVHRFLRHGDPIIKSNTITVTVTP
jgi:hypothetical protein